MATFIFTSLAGAGVVAAPLLVLVAEDLVAALALNCVPNASITAPPCRRKFTTVPGKGVAEDQEEELNT